MRWVITNDGIGVDKCKFYPDPIYFLRPGHLSLPEALPQALAATGYRNSSSITANEALTHLPYPMMHDRAYRQELDVIEIPVTIEDEQGKLGDRLDKAIALSEKIARYRGLVNILIHTNELGHKLAFEKGYVAAFRGRAWFSTVRDYADWWRARNSVQLHAREYSGTRTLDIVVDGEIQGLTLEVPASWRYEGGVEGTAQNGTDVVLGRIVNKASAEFRIEQVIPHLFLPGYYLLFILPRYNSAPLMTGSAA